MHSTIKTQTSMEMIPCVKCGNDMPELRKTQYGYNFCVNCSTVGTKRGLPVQMGSGDHTWTETIIMEEEDYMKYTEQEELIAKTSKTPKVKLDDDERDLQGPFRIINNTTNEDY